MADRDFNHYKSGGWVKEMDGHKDGGRLTYQERKHLPKNSFVFPGERRYPITDVSHGRNALSRVAQHGTPAEKAKVRSAVHRKFPDIGKD